MNRLKAFLFTFGALASASQASEIPAQLDLDAALDLALQHSYAIQQARAQYAEAIGAVEESRSGRLPTLSASAGYTRTDKGLLSNLNGTTFGSQDQWQAGVTASQTVYSGGAVSAGIKASEASREASAANFESSVQDALQSVRERYYDVLLARQQVEVQVQSVKLLEEELANATARVDAGSGSPFDKLRAEVALANGKPPLIRARNDVRLAAVELLRAIGLPAEEGAETKIVGELSFDGGELSLDDALLSARENRPELQQLRKSVEAAEHAVDAAKAGSRPVLGVFGSYEVRKSQFSNDFGDSIDGWTAGVQASWDIFDGNATKGRVAQARSRLEQARVMLNETLLAIDAEVRQAGFSYEEARELVGASQQVVAQAEESVRLARSRFDAGAATQLDVLQAEVALTEARTNEALSLHDANVAQTRLRRAASLDALPAGVSLADRAK